MKIAIYGLFGLIFLGLFVGGARVIGETETQGRPVALEIEIPRARVLPGHPFYVLKELGRFLESPPRRLRGRLAELYGLLLEKRSSTDFLDAADAYRENITNISFEESFYQAQAFSRLEKEFPEAADVLRRLRGNVLLALRDSILAAPADFSLRVSRFTGNPLPAIGFFDEMARMVLESKRKARILFYQHQIASDFHGRYLAGEFRLGAIFYFLSQEKNFFSALRILDVLREIFPEGELASQLQFFRQEILQKPGVFSLDIAMLEEEVQALEEGLAAVENISDADFNYDRALEFYSSGLYDRALAQASLSFSSLHSFLLDSFQSSEAVRREVYLFRDEFQSLEQEFRKKAGRVSSEALLFLKQAEEGISELLVFVGRNETPPFFLISRVRALLVALKEVR